jgi:hypothetical protein
MTERNPKQDKSVLFDCRPQTGTCPNNCSQCFYNRPDAYYQDIHQPSIPTPEEVGDGIVRMNCGHDSNIERELVIETAKQYKHYFFNTSIPNLDFPGPVVLTANPREEEGESCYLPSYESYDEDGDSYDNLMFVRLRVSPTNLYWIEDVIRSWTCFNIPVVLTFMAYYDDIPPGTKPKTDSPGYFLEDKSEFKQVAYTWQKRHINSYYCATSEFMQYVTRRMKRIGGRLVTKCGTVDSRYCKDCQNCSTYYWQTRKHLQEI